MIHLLSRYRPRYARSLTYMLQSTEYNLGDYLAWYNVFSPVWMKIATLTFLACLFYHAWVGMRDIWMDYVQPVAIRLVLQVFTIVWLLACAGWAIQVLWRL